VKPSSLRIGLLGTARIAPRAIIAPARANPGVEVVAVAARDADRAAGFARKHAISRVHHSYDALLADPEIDAIYNPLPNSLHAQWSIRALRAGKHVLCEKPMAANAGEAAQMAHVARETGLVLFEAFHYRYHPLALRAKEILDSGEIGPIRHIDAQFCTLMLRTNDIRLNYELGGGALMDLGCYTINMIRSFSGLEPTVLRADATLSSPQVDRSMDVGFSLGDGITARTFCSFRSRALFRIDLSITGKQGSVRVGNIILPQVVYHKLTVTTAQGKRSESFPKTSTYALQLDAFVNAVGGAAYPTDAAAGVRNMRVIDAAYEAAGLEMRGMVN
jgi:predicted dehydrogenase